MFVFLDNNGTTPLKSSVQDAVSQALMTYGNPSSAHQVGQQARMAVDTARRAVADAFSVRSEQVVFTSSGTESNVMALRGMLAESDAKRLITSPTEHPSVYNTAMQLKSEGVDVVLLNVDENGIVDLVHLKEELQKEPTALVSIMWANNETGVVQPIENIVELAHGHGALCHVDAVQWAGKHETSFPELGADAMSVSFHKFGGLKGCGALLLKNEVKMRALITGGGQERNRRAGTENTLGIISAGEACAQISENSAENERLSQLREMLEQGMRNLYPSTVIVGESARRIATTTAAILPNISGEMAVMSMDMAGVCISQGSACSSGRSVPSRVLLAQGFSEEQALCGVRISLAWHNTSDDVQAFLKAFETLTNRFK